MTRESFRFNSNLGQFSFGSEHLYGLMEGLVSIGKVVRLHGYEGEVSIRFDEDAQAYLRELGRVLIILDNKEVPFFIEGLRPQNKGFYLVRLDGVNDEQTARSIQGKQVWVEAEAIGMHPSEQRDLQFLQYWKVIDASEGFLGHVVAVQELPAHPVIEVAVSGGSALIPLVEPILTSMDEESKTIYVECPLGLLDLYRGDG